MSDAIDRAMSRFIPEPNSGCWLWTAALDEKGYSRISVAGKWRYGHRVIYEAIVGKVPDGLELDHVCRNPCCVNPDHLDPVSHAENVRRAGAAGVLGARNRNKTRCNKGHEFSAANTYIGGYGTRYCRTCRRDYMREYYRSRKSRVQAC